MPFRKLALAAVGAALLVVPPVADAQGPVTIGSDLAANKPVNQNLGCRLRPNTSVIGGLIDTQLGTCTWWPAPGTDANTYVPTIGQGRITSARVRSGANPAPLQITILSSGSGLCCTIQRHSATFQPVPNAITEVQLDLPAEAGLDPNRGGSQFTDIVAVSAVGPGDIPVHDYGTHGNFTPGIPASVFLHPQLAPGQSNTDVGYADGWETLLNVTWTPNSASSGSGGGGGGGGSGNSGGGSGSVVPTVAGVGIDRAGRTLQLQVSGPSRVDAVLAKKSGKKFKTVKKLRKTVLAAGAVKLKIPKSVKAGTYRATVTATDASGVRSAKVVKTIKVKKP